MPFTRCQIEASMVVHGLFTYDLKTLLQEVEMCTALRSVIEYFIGA